MGYNASETEFNAVNKAGGAKTVTLTTAQMPSHSHTIKDAWRASGGTGSNNTIAGYPETGRTGQYNFFTAQTGGNSPHGNLQPYQVCYMWRRTV